MLWPKLTIQFWIYYTHHLIFWLWIAITWQSLQWRITFSYIYICEVCNVFQVFHLNYVKHTCTWKTYALGFKFRYGSFGILKPINQLKLYRYTHFKSNRHILCVCWCFNVVINWEQNSIRFWNLCNAASLQLFRSILNAICLLLFQTAHAFYCIGSPSHRPIELLRHEFWWFRTWMSFFPNNFNVYFTVCDNSFSTFFHCLLLYPK